MSERAALSEFRDDTGPTLEQLLERGEVEAALIIDKSWGNLTARELEIARRAWEAGLKTGKELAQRV